MGMAVSLACHSVGGCYIDSMGIDMVDSASVRAFAGLSGHRAVGIHRIATPPRTGQEKTISLENHGHFMIAAGQRKGIENALRLSRVKL